MHPRNAIVIPRNQPQHVLANHLVLVRVHVVNPGNMDPHAGKHGLPPRHPVRADNGVVRRKGVAAVEGRPAGRHDFVVSCGGGGAEDRLGTVGG